MCTIANGLPLHLSDNLVDVSFWRIPGAVDSRFGTLWLMSEKRQHTLCLTTPRALKRVQSAALHDTSLADLTVVVFMKK